MLIRQDFKVRGSDLPPRPFLEMVLDSVSKIYCFLWDRKDTENQIKLTWNGASKFFSKNTFRCSLRKLCAEGLLSYREDDEGIQIELVGWDEIAS